MIRWMKSGKATLQSEYKSFDASKALELYQTGDLEFFVRTERASSLGTVFHNCLSF